MKHLDDWWKHGRFAIDDFSKWLQSQSPEEWHLATVGTTHDGDHQQLHWVISQPECELSTALTIFWAGNPSEALQYSYASAFSSAKNDNKLYASSSAASYTWQIQFKILENFKRGFYTRRNIAFPPEEAPGLTRSNLAESLESYLEAETSLKNLGLNVPWNFDRGLAMPFAGRRAVSNYSIDEGAIVHLRYDLWCKIAGKTEED